VYGTKDYYGSPHFAATPPAIVVGDYPERGLTSTIALGSVPTELFRARERLLALDLLRGGNLIGWLQGHAELEVSEDEIQRRAEGRISDANWYVTISIALAPAVVDGPSLVALEEWRGRLKPGLDVLAAYIGASMSATVLEEVVLEDPFVRRPGGSQWVKLPQFSAGSVRAIVGRDATRLATEVAELNQRLRSKVATHSYQATPLILHWYLMALQQSDPRDQFLWAFFSLERLANETVDFHLTRADFQRLWPLAEPEILANGTKVSSHKWRQREELPLIAKFALTGADLAVANWPADVATFKELNKIRVDLAHGLSAVDPAPGPRADASTLTMKFVGAALASGRSFRT